MVKKYSLKERKWYNTLNVYKDDLGNTYYYRRLVYGYRVNRTNWFVHKNDKNKKCTIYDLASGIKIHTYEGNLTCVGDEIKKSNVLDKWKNYVAKNEFKVDYFSDILNDIPTREQLMKELDYEKET